MEKIAGGNLRGNEEEDARTNERALKIAWLCATRTLHLRHSPRVRNVRVTLVTRGLSLIAGRFNNRFFGFVLGLIIFGIFQLQCTPSTSKLFRNWCWTNFLSSFYYPWIFVMKFRFLPFENLFIYRIELVKKIRVLKEIKMQQVGKKILK